MRKDNLKIKGRVGTWYVIDKIILDGKTYYILESEIYGDMADFLYVDENFNEVSEKILEKLI